MSLFSKLSKIVLPILVLIHSLLFIFFWVTNALFYTETNDYLTRMLGLRFDYISLFLILSFLIAIWSAVRLLTFNKGWKHHLMTLTSIVYFILGIIYLVFFYGSFWMLFQKSAVQIPRLLQLLSYYRVFLDGVILLGISLGLGLWVKRIYLHKAQSNKKPGILPILLSAIGLAVIWVIAVTVPPDSVYRGELPAKPLLIAHRGASMLAPENTIVAAKLAADLKVYGLETDIHISQDGLPFLLHDDTFERTTDVATLYPDRIKERAEYFTLAEATKLNAGKWFVERDPYKTIKNGQVSQDQIDQYKLQTIPILEDELQIIKDNRLAFIYDIKQPPEDQAYAQNYFEKVIDIIHEVGIDPQVWVLADQQQAKLVRTIAPEMKLAYGVKYQTPPSIEELLSSGYQIVNSEYGLGEAWIRKYQEAGLWVNLYTIDEPWQYSRLWLLGADSTTSSNAHTLVALSKPVMSMSYELYLVVWGLLGLASLGLLLGLILPTYNKATSPKG
jgi:glycerophosphoinositol inositolphosphodiesterase